MSPQPPRPIRTGGVPASFEARVPPSKSYTNRALIAAALAQGQSTILSPSRSQDSNYMAGALASFGVEIQSDARAMRISGSGGRLRAPRKPIFVGNAGTTFRFLTALAAVADGATTITGDARMKERPVAHLLEALERAGVRSTSTNGFPPVTVEGGTLLGGSPVAVSGTTSSQYLSAMLLVSPYARQPMELSAGGALSSAPYVGMTLEVMRAFGAEVEASPDGTYRVPAGVPYKGRRFAVEPDASAASYFLAAAAVTGTRVRIPGLSVASLQGDVRFVETLCAMGCTLPPAPAPGALELAGGELKGIDVDMNAMPDCVPALAVVALFAQGATSIRNVAHLRHKESDRLAALGAELSRLGALVELLPDGLVIHPRPLNGVTIETYRDHRIAMSFAVAGLKIPGVAIADPGCVAKSFPAFWQEFTALEPSE